MSRIKDPHRPLAHDEASVLRELLAAKGAWVEGLYAKTDTMVHSRVSNLRQRGYAVECKRFGQRDYRYRLQIQNGNEKSTRETSRPE